MAFSPCSDLYFVQPVLSGHLAIPRPRVTRLRLLQTFEGLLFAECLFFDQIKVNYLNLHFQKQII